MKEARVAERQEAGWWSEEARVAKRQEAGWWGEGGESGGAAGPGMVDIGSWSCGATSCIVQELEDRSRGSE